MTGFWKVLKCAALVTVMGVAAASSAMAQSNARTPAASTRLSGNPVVHEFNLNTPFDIVQFRVTTTGPNLVTELRDCCIVGDQYTQRTYCSYDGQTWDVRGKTRDDSLSQFSAKTEVWKTGSQRIDCIVEIRYAAGLGVFPAGLDARFSSASGTVTTTLLSTEVPLPSQ